MTDLRLAVRQCRRRPVLWLAAVVSLALGIGANTAIFTVLHGSVLQPLPFAKPDRLMVVWETTLGNPRRSVAPANFLDWRRETRAFSGLAAFDDFSATLTGQGEAERVRAVSASANIFEVLGVAASVGRVPTAGEDRPDLAPVAMLTDGFWHRLFGADRTAIGKTLVINGITYTIIGVLPPWFELPMVTSPDVWLTGDRGIPRSFPFPGDLAAVRDSHVVAVIGRLADGVSRERAQAEVSSVMVELGKRYPNTNAGLGANVMPLHEEIVGNVRPIVVLLQSAVALLLLIACANVAHLLLGQAAGRRAEMAMRAALGADRRRLVRQLLIESLVLAVPGGALGLVVAAAGTRALVDAAPATVPRLGAIHLDATVLVFAAVTTVVTAVVFGAGPAVQVARTSCDSLGQAGRRLTGGHAIRRWQHAIVVGELALAQMLLMGAGLLLVSFVHATHIDLGFATEGRVAAEINLVPDYVRAVGDEGRIDPARKIQFILSVIGQVSQQPGVRAVAAAFTAPLTGAPNRGIHIDGDPERAPNDEPNADFQLVTRDFFRAAGITLVRGRAFTEADRTGAPGVAIVNRALVEKYFAGRDPVGHVLRFGGNRRHEIVGVVADARYRTIEQPADPTFYLPLEQNDERWPFLSFIVWSDTAGTAPMPSAGPVVGLRAAIRQADPRQPISRIRSLDEIVSQALSPRRFNTWLVGLFAMTALLLAAVGIYGVMHLAVAARTQELGVRAAVGASPGDLARLILGQGLRLTIAATLLGLTGAIVFARAIESMLFGVAPRDPWTFAAVAATLGVVALAATMVPAIKAMRVGALTALREP